MPHRVCEKCQTEVIHPEENCSLCNRTAPSPATIRVLGGFMIIIGLFLIGVMSFISLWMYQVIVHPETTNGESFSGDETDLMMIIGIFSFVILIGIVALITGIWQLVFAKRNTLLIRIVMVLGVIFIVGGEILVAFWK